MTTCVPMPNMFLKRKNLHIYTALTQSLSGDLEWPTDDCDRDQEKCGSDDVTQFDTSTKDHAEHKSLKTSFSPRSSRYSNTPHLFNAYSDVGNKYTGDRTEEIDQNFSLFIERCEQDEVETDEDLRKAFSTVPAGDARKYYFQTLRSRNLDLLSLLSEIRNRLQTKERTKTFLREWDI